MAVRGLIDTGAILAFLDTTDLFHHDCHDALAEFRFPLLTSEAVLTELFHFVLRKRFDLEAAWAFIHSDVIHVVAIEDHELPNIHTLMTRYADRPMDFADATLVYLARRESVSTILTVDHADFATYRIEGNRRFRVLPAARP